MKRFAMLMFFLSFAVSAQAADPAADAGLSVVSDLGRLNGQVLSCGYMDIAAQIKAAMIKFAPKSRLHGSAFEEATNEAFLEQSRQERSACLDGPTFSSRVEEATQRLQAAAPAVLPAVSPASASQ